jgi:voltage-gated potassium channel
MTGVRDQAPGVSPDIHTARSCGACCGSWDPPPCWWPLYFLLPLTHSSDASAVTILAIGVAVFIGLVVFQVRSIIRSPFPGLRGIEALATSVPLFVLLFASTYVVMAGMSADNFGERLTHTDGLYFTVTVLSTVGFGDITAKSQAARLVVTGQMIGDLVILGIAIKLIVGAVSRRRQPADVGGERPSQEIADGRGKPEGT